MNYFVINYLLTSITFKRLGILWLVYLLCFHKYHYHGLVKIIIELFQYRMSLSLSAFGFYTIYASAHIFAENEWIVTRSETTSRGKHGFRAREECLTTRRWVASLIRGKAFTNLPDKETSPKTTKEQRSWRELAWALSVICDFHLPPLPRKTRQPAFLPSRDIFRRSMFSNGDCSQ